MQIYACKICTDIFACVPTALEWQASSYFPLNVIAFTPEAPVMLLIFGDTTNKLAVLRRFISLTLFNRSHFQLT